MLDDNVARLLETLRRLLASAGTLLIQTVHPWTACADADYQDGWRREDFAAFGTAFAEPMPWYFRTLETWMRDLACAGYTVEAIHEPRHPRTGQPLSLLLAARIKDLDR